MFLIVSKKKLAALERRVEELEKRTMILKDADSVMVFEKPVVTTPPTWNAEKGCLEYREVGA